jgi:hypothetical protein
LKCHLLLLVSKTMPVDLELQRTYLLWFSEIS